MSVETVERRGGCGGWVAAQDNTAVIVGWEEPPHSPRVGCAGKQFSHKWTALAEQLQARPGEWAIVDPRAGYAGQRLYAVAYGIRRGMTVAFSPGGEFDAAVRRVDGVDVLYVRYVGEPAGGEW
jgi:hypothetical protein